MVSSALASVSVGGLVVLQPLVWKASKMIKQAIADIGRSALGRIMPGLITKIVPMTFPRLNDLDDMWTIHAV
jgi:hypothetical protein